MIRSSSPTEQVHGHLLRAIPSGERAPGGTPREVEIATRPGVSRTPVRQALTRLAEYGVVEIRPNRGENVGQLGCDEVTHFHRVRGATGGMAAAPACPRMTAGDFERPDGLAEAAGDSHSTGSFKASNAYDFGRHLPVAERSGDPAPARGSRRFLELTTPIGTQLGAVLPGRRQIMAIDQRELRRIGVAQHIEVVEAPRSGDPGAGRDAMVRHIRAGCTPKVDLRSLRSAPFPDSGGDRTPRRGVERVVSR